MKKIILSIAIIATAAIAGWNYQQNKQSVMLSDLALENIEALARWEGTTQSNRIVTNTIINMETTPYGIKTTYLRSCSNGGSQHCTPGTWSEVTYK